MVQREEKTIEDLGGRLYPDGANKSHSYDNIITWSAVPHSISNKTYRPMPVPGGLWLYNLYFMCTCVGITSSPLMALATLMSLSIMPPIVLVINVHYHTGSTYPISMIWSAREKVR